MIILKTVLNTAVFLMLTALSQVGGVAYLAAVLGPKLSHWRRAGVFVAAYAALWIASMVVAPWFGRVPVSCGLQETPHLEMQSPLYCALNRHYVTPELRQIALDLASHVNARHPDTTTIVLDGSFPFFDGFPLLPHLSHDDGQKLDFAFYYSKDGRTKSPIGYWAFEDPDQGDRQPCTGLAKVGMRWDMEWFAVFHNDLEFDEARTRTALHWLASEGSARGVGKVFVEPHLVDRLGLSGNVIRFQGCRAARHDDHIHIQLAR